MNFFCHLTIVIPRLSCLFNMANAVSSTVELVHSRTSNCASSFNFAMCDFASMCLPWELVPCSERCRRTWWNTIHMMPALLVSSIPQCKRKCHEVACREFFDPITHLEPRFFDAPQASKTICKVRLVKSQTKSSSLLEDIILSSNKVFIDWESDMAIRRWRLGYSGWETVQGDIIIE